MDQPKRKRGRPRKIIAPSPKKLLPPLVKRLWTPEEFAEMQAIVDELEEISRRRAEVAKRFDTWRDTVERRTNPDYKPG